MLEKKLDGRTAFLQQDIQAENTAGTLLKGLEGAHSPDPEIRRSAKRGLKAVRAELRENPGMIRGVKDKLSRREIKTGEKGEDKRLTQAIVFVNRIERQVK